MQGMLNQILEFGGGTGRTIFSILADTALKGAVLIAAAAIAAYFLRKKSAAARHAVWTAAVLGHLALPVLSVLVPEWRIPLLPAPGWLAEPTASSSIELPADVDLKESTPSPVTDARELTEPAAVDATPTAIVSTEPDTATSLSTASILTMLWILGAVLVLLRLAVGTWQVGKLAKHGDLVDDGEWLSLTQRVAKRLGITRPMTLLRGDSLAVPVTWGVVYPAVLLPHESEEWPEARRRFVLVHEMAHVKRFDALTQLIAQITAAVLWFDPLLWYAAHRMRVEREHACDDYVIRDGTTPSLYAGDLLEMVQSIGTSGHENTAPAFAALAMARRSEFEGRMLAILDNRQDRHTLGRRHALLTTAAVALFVVPLAALKPFASASATSASPVILASQTSSLANDNGKSAKYVPLSDIACDSVMEIPVDRAKRNVNWTHLHVLENQKDELATLEFLSYNPDRCAQAIIQGPATIEGDELIALGAGSHAYFREISGTENRLLRIDPGDGGRFSFKASIDNKPASYDDATRRWISNLLPEALRETSVDADDRVARWVVRGGVDRALAQIRRINSTSSKREHYLALLEGTVLSAEQIGAVRDHVARYMPAASSDRKAVIAKLASLEKRNGGSSAPSVTSLKDRLEESNSSGDSARVLGQYVKADDDELILMALQGAKDLSSDGDRRVLLQQIAPRALGRKNVALRKAFFEASAEMTSDEDLRVVLMTALAYARTDPEVTLAVFNAVKTQMTSDDDKRVTLQTAIAHRLLTTSAVRQAFNAAARSIQSDGAFSALMQGVLQK